MQSDIASGNRQNPAIEALDFRRLPLIPILDSLERWRQCHD
jgi:hypothetical protein